MLCQKMIWLIAKKKKTVLENENAFMMMMSDGWADLTYINVKQPHNAMHVNIILKYSFCVYIHDVCIVAYRIQCRNFNLLSCVHIFTGFIVLDENLFLKNCGYF